MNAIRPCLSVALTGLLLWAAADPAAAQEKSEPYANALYELDDASIRSGRYVYRSRLKWLKQCQESGEWPGYCDGIESIRVPQWALMEGGIDE